MGLRRWLNRTVRGVEDLTRGDEDYPIEHRREWAIETIDDAPFQWWVVVVAGIGFLTDSYDIFALNVVNPMLGYVYWPEKGVMPRGWGTAMMCSTLAGTMIGQIVFGIGADFLGRRKMYGLELIMVIVATMLFAMSSNGAEGSMAVQGWLITWRFIMGIGIGADYPLSAVITSEFAPRQHRARMMATVFFMQPIGQLLATLISLAVVTAWQDWLPTDVNNNTCYHDIPCIQVIDRMWRLVVGLGSVPALIALAFRLTIPESPRYKMDVRKKIEKAVEDTNDYYGRELDTEEVIQESHRPKSSMHLLPQQDDHFMPSSGGPIATPRTTRDTLATTDGGILNTDEDFEPLPSPRIAPTERMQSERPHIDPFADPPYASRQDMYDYFITQGNWLWLAGTSLSWLFLDYAFYGLGLSSPTILRHIWEPKRDDFSVRETLRDNAIHYLILISIGATCGGALMIKVIKHVSPKTIQFYGFIVLAFLFMIIGSVWDKLLASDDKPTGLWVLYILCQLVFNLGPNVTTFIIPAEIFPTRYRATCHGLAAASGKLGSWVAQLFIAFAPWRKTENDRADSNGDQEWLGHVLQVMTAFMVAGAAVTWFMVPETRDSKGRSRSLEVLALGRQGLMRMRKEEKGRGRDVDGASGAEKKEREPVLRRGLGSLRR